VATKTPALAPVFSVKAQRWAPVVFLCAFMALNFWDRTVLGLAAVPITRDLHLSHATFGLLGGSFFILFSISAFALGSLGDRWAVKWLLASMALTWAIAQALMAGARVFSQALVARILLGAGEGSAFPTALHGAFFWVSKDQRALASAIIAIGIPLGTSSGAILLTFAIERFGWQWTFALLSAISLLWCLLWILLPSPAEAQPASEPTRVTAKMQSNKALAGVGISLFAVYWVLGLAVNWFPAALETATQLSPHATGVALGIAWALQIPVYASAAWLSSRLLRQYGSVRTAFATPAVAAIGLSGAALAGMGIAVHSAAATVLMGTCLVLGAVAVTCLPPIVGEVSPEHRRGTTFGVVVGISSLGGFFSPIVFGKIIDAGSYQSALILSGAFIVVAATASFGLMQWER